MSESGLKITFTPETPEQREKAIKEPWWKGPHADKAKQLIADEAIRRGQPTPFQRGPNGCYGGSYGSGWFIELPRYVAILIGEAGEEAAVEYVKWTFDEGSSRDAMEKLQARDPDYNPCVAYYG